MNIYTYKKKRCLPQRTLLKTLHSNIRRTRPVLEIMDLRSSLGMLHMWTSSEKSPVTTLCNNTETQTLPVFFPSSFFSLPLSPSFLFPSLLSFPHSLPLSLFSFLLSFLTSLLVFRAPQETRGGILFIEFWSHKTTYNTKITEPSIKWTRAAHLSERSSFK